VGANISSEALCGTEKGLLLPAWVADGSDASQGRVPKTCRKRLSGRRRCCSATVSAERIGAANCRGMKCGRRSQMRALSEFCRAWTLGRLNHNHEPVSPILAAATEA
jgi:hypothetical protein